MDEFDHTARNLRIHLQNDLGMSLMLQEAEFLEENVSAALRQAEQRGRVAGMRAAEQVVYNLALATQSDSCQGYFSRIILMIQERIAALEAPPHGS